MFKAPIVKHSLKYNPALDGLRGVAILLVVLFHIWPQYYSFGYIGVDIFFVISGFMITNIIYTKLNNNSFSFLEFYRNRIRRIFPALIIVLLCVFSVGYLLLFPSEFETVGSHIKSSSFFYQNFRLIAEDGYWDESSILKPLLHFWSLSIEEQFYLFWPLLLFLAYKFKIKLDVFLVSIFTIFLLLGFFVENNYYSSISRFWELATGGICNVLVVNRKTNIFKFRYLIYLFFVFAILIHYNNINFSFYKTFITVLSTALVILLVAKNPYDKIMANYFLNFLGLISYPLYLIHYVLISYIYIFALDMANMSFLVFILSVVLAYIIYRYVEIFCRKQTSYKFAGMLAIIVVMIGLIGNYTYKNGGFPNRNHIIIEKNLEFEKQFIRTAPKDINGTNLLAKILGHEPTNNYIKSSSNDIGAQFVLITGDSHAHTSYPGFEQEFKKHGYETILLANSSCPPYIDGAMGKTMKDLLSCKEKIDNIYNLINSKLDIKKVIFISRMGYMYDIGFGIIDDGGLPWNYHYKNFFLNDNTYNQKTEFINVLAKTFEYFNDRTDIDFYYLIENPELGFSPKNCLVRPYDIFDINCKLSTQKYLKRSGEYRNIVYGLSKKFEKIHILDPKPLYCDNNYCYAVKDEKILYADDDHHSIDGSIIQAKYFIEEIVNVEK